MLEPGMGQEPCWVLGSFRSQGRGCLLDPEIWTLLLPKPLGVSLSVGVGGGVGVGGWGGWVEEGVGGKPGWTHILNAAVAFNASRGPSPLP